MYVEKSNKSTCNNSSWYQYYYLTTLSDQSKPNRGVQAVMYGRPNKAYIYNATTDAKQ